MRYDLYMNTISLYEAAEILENCEAVILVDQLGNPVLYPSLSELTGGKDNEFLLLTWESDDYEWGIKFVEGNNSRVKLENNQLTLVDHEGDEVILKILIAGTPF